MSEAKPDVQTNNPISDAANFKRLTLASKIVSLRSSWWWLWVKGPMKFV
jgi:hypothetical protein